MALYPLILHYIFDLEFFHKILLCHNSVWFVCLQRVLFSEIIIIRLWSCVLYNVWLCTTSKILWMCFVNSTILRIYFIRYKIAHNKMNKRGVEGKYFFILHDVEKLKLNRYFDEKSWLVVYFHEWKECKYSQFNFSSQNLSVECNFQAIIFWCRK